VRGGAFTCGVSASPINGNYRGRRLRVAKHTSYISNGSSVACARKQRNNYLLLSNHKDTPDVESYTRCREGPGIREQSVERERSRIGITTSSYHTNHKIALGLLTMSIWTRLRWNTAMLHRHSKSSSLGRFGLFFRSSRN
jgi:hypothetical protein